MIINIVEDYSFTELNNFIQEYPNRYKKLCEIVGEFSLARRHVYLGIVLPYKEDKGCVIVSVFKDDINNVIDCRYF